MSVTSSKTGRIRVPKTRDFVLLQTACKWSEVNCKERASTIYGGTGTADLEGNETAGCNGQRAAVTKSLIQCAKVNGYDSYAYRKDALRRLVTQHAGSVEELLPHRWQPLVSRNA